MPASTYWLSKMWERIDKTDTCWLWIGATSANGYGVTSAGNGNRLVGAHRRVYELLVGPIPEGLQLDHLCRVRNCVNPAHLEPVTPSVNQQRMGAVKTACPKGHGYDAANTYMYRGRRNCRRCHADRQLARNHRVAAA